ncbi:MAG: hypothetical protein AB7U47_16515 [Variibacter sp.]
MRVSLVAVLTAVLVLVAGASAEARPNKRDHREGVSQSSHRSAHRTHHARKAYKSRTRVAQRDDDDDDWVDRPQRRAPSKRAHRTYADTTAEQDGDMVWEGAAPRRVTRHKSGRNGRSVATRTYETTSFSMRRTGLGPRPRAWCGWWMRSQRGGGPEFNVAWNWRRYGRPAEPQVGAVVIWRHHVGEITGRASNGMWIVRSGNDGGRVRERARSVSGALFRI